MQELEAVLHAVLLQFFEAFADFRHGEAELRPVAAGGLPPAAAAGGKLHAHADVRPHADLLAVVEDELEFGVFLDDRDDAAAHLLGQHRHLDELGVFEAVADDRRVVVGHRDHGKEFRLRAGLHTEAVLTAELEHFFDDLPLLVDLDRVDADVLAGVVVLADRAREGGADVGEPVFQNFGEPDEDRQPDTAQLQRIDQLLQVDGAFRILVAVDEQVPVGRDREVPLAPAVDFVQLIRVRDRPRIARPPLPRSAAGCTHSVRF